MYNDFEFISAEIIVAEVKQRLKTYFDSGALTEVMLPTYIDNSLRKLKRMVLEFKEDVVEVDNYRAKLPEDFAYLKDAYLCGFEEVITNPVVTNNYEYYKKVYCNDTCENEYETFTQVTCETPSTIRRMVSPCLLKVYQGSKTYCTTDCKGLIASNLDEIKIYKKTVTANFETGSIYIQYFTRPSDEYGPMIPDLIEVEEYVKAFMYYQLFEDLYNSVVDESINIIERKLQYYRQLYKGKHEAALNMLKLQSKQQVRDNINRDRRRFIKHIIT